MTAATATILLVEDEPVSRRNLGVFLRFAGYKVLEADSAEAAFTLLSDNTFDIVISDYALSGKATGTDVLRRFESMAPGRPKFLVSGNDLKHAASVIGAVHIYKPIALEDLIVVIQSLLKKDDSPPTDSVQASQKF